MTTDRATIFKEALPAVVSGINTTLDSLKLACPTVSREQKEALLAAKAELEQEGTGTTTADREEKKAKK